MIAILGLPRHVAMSETVNPPRAERPRSSCRPRCRTRILRGGRVARPGRLRPEDRSEAFQRYWTESSDVRRRWPTWTPGGHGSACAASGTVGDDWPADRVPQGRWSAFKGPSHLVSQAPFALGDEGALSGISYLSPTSAVRTGFQEFCARFVS